MPTQYQYKYKGEWINCFVTKQSESQRRVVFVNPYDGQNDEAWASSSEIRIKE